MWDAKDPELDDAMHNPDPRIDAALDRRLRLFSSRGWMNASAMILILLGLLMLFAGYPIIAFGPLASINSEKAAAAASNATGTVPIPSLVDKDTPSSALSKTGSDGKKYKLVFSDEFETAGRSFYPGDDPYWTAVDFHYWPTGDLEWYDPKAATTADGKLVLTMTAESIHGLNYSSAMLQTWNQFCFTTGIFEVSISMPGSSREVGFWPGAWSMGNLGRAGYGATTEGTWPYSYDACDLGTFPNQTFANGTPTADATGGIGGSALSFLPGQRVSACTCEGSDHPGPDVTVGRNAPEIDIVEARIDTTNYVGQASQSLQTAPFNYQYNFDNTSAIASIQNTSQTILNTYKGGNSQQALSAQSYFSTGSYGGQAYSSYAYEWWADQDKRSDGYVQWYVEDKKTWKVDSSSLAGDDITQISSRLIPEEPMSLILNFGMAPSFQEQDFTTLTFPNKMYVDYVRVYQREDVAGGDSISCSPPSHPTSEYITNHPEAYGNANLTTWAQAGYTFPRNRLFDGC
ncbi:glycoside hydrolase family 16 protein [Peniophora sp. CONT]|nr:glycoside hydrolase family 16 protein [Peniophora sp. CONT]